jgi:hypothetical protein
VVGGPAQSGKSIFGFELKRHLPIGSYMPIRAAPDGEGDWTQKLYRDNPALAKELRKKGKFSRAFVEWAAKCVRNCTARFCLIDVGGKITKENYEICEGADSIIILSGYPELTQEWLAFAEKLNLKVLAIVESALTTINPDATEWWRVEDGVFRGCAVDLVRELYKGSQTIEQLVSFLLETIPAQTSKEDHPMNTLTIEQIATMIGKEKEEITLPNGRQVIALNWRPEDLKAVVAKLQPISTLGTPWFLDGPGPQWLAATIMHALHPCPIVLSDSKVEGGQVPIGQRKYPIKGGQGELNFTTEKFGKFVRVKYESAEPITAELLPELIPPTTPKGKPVLLNGKTSTWGVVEMVSAYMHMVPAVFVGQPLPEGYMYVCSTTHNRNYKIGDVIWEKDLVEA